MEEYDLKLEGSFSTSDEATDADYMHEAYADEPLADAQWLALCEEERKVKGELEKKLQKQLNGTEEAQNW